MPSSNFHNYLKTNLKVAADKKEVLDSALELTGKDLEQTLITSGIVTEQSLAKLKADYYHLPFLTLDEIQVEEGVHELIPASFIRNHKVVPFAREGRVLSIATSDPTNIQALQALEFLSKKNDWDVKMFMVTPADLNALLHRSIGVAAEVKQAVKEFTTTQSAKARLKKNQHQPIEFEIEEKAPVAKIVDGLLSQALASHASDIHIEPMEEDVRIRFRIDGILREVFAFPKNAHAALVSRVKILSNLKIDEQRLPQDGRIRFHWNDQDVDFRISTFPTAQGEKVVMRALQRSNDIPDFDQLGLVGQQLDVVMKAIANSYGMLLVTGPTGSGKSTTLFVALSKLNKPGVNIVTLEDPVEYVLPGANQGQVNPDIGFTFSSGLRSILRQDPNIILVGEIRDHETAELAVHSALTGHLVFSTLHTNDAVGALPRLIDMGVEPFLIVASVNAVLAQRLVRRICEDCKQEIETTKEVTELIAKELLNVPAKQLEGLDISKPKIYRGKGCKKCGGKGYKGRVGIFEAVDMTKEIGDLTVAKSAPHKLREQALAQGSVTLKQDGFIKVLRGITTIEEVLRETSN